MEFNQRLVFFSTLFGLLSTVEILAWYSFDPFRSDFGSNIRPTLDNFGYMPGRDRDQKYYSRTGYDAEYPKPSTSGILVRRKNRRYKDVTKYFKEELV